MQPGSGACHSNGWAEAPIKIARMTLTIKLDGNWSSFQLANNTPPLSVTGSVIAPSARMLLADTLIIPAIAACARQYLIRELEHIGNEPYDTHTDKGNGYPEGCAAPGNVQCQCNAQGPLSKLERAPSQRKINVTSKSPVGDISVVTLIRTDTTLDHSQKAEKVCSTRPAWRCVEENQTRGNR